MQKQLLFIKFIHSTVGPCRVESGFSWNDSDNLSHFIAVFSLQDNRCEHCGEKFPKLEMLEVGIFVGILPGYPNSWYPPRYPAFLLINDKTWVS